MSERQRQVELDLRRFSASKTRRPAFGVQQKVSNEDGKNENEPVVHEMKISQSLSQVTISQIPKRWARAGDVFQDDTQSSNPLRKLGRNVPGVPTAMRPLIWSTTDRLGQRQRQVDPVRNGQAQCEGEGQDREPVARIRSTAVSVAVPDRIESTIGKARVYFLEARQQFARRSHQK